MLGPLAVAGQVVEVNPIVGADRIQLATVICGTSGKWTGVVGKELEISESVVVFLQDALLPPDARWAFMEKQNWRVRMCRFRGAPSECLILRNPRMDEIGTDLTEVFGVTKYEKPIPAGAAGDIAGNFPSWIKRTDEDNFQRTPELVDRMKTEPWFATEKADGTSCTVWNCMVDGRLRVCSRNYELKEFTESGGSNLYWRIARKYAMERIPALHAIQFEICGPGVQGNPMGLAEQEIRVFNVYDVLNRRTLSFNELRLCCEKYTLPPARCITNYLDRNPQTEDDLRELANIKYANGTPAEGIVVRAADSSWSFKVINLMYKD